MPASRILSKGSMPNRSRDRYSSQDQHRRLFSRQSFVNSPNSVGAREEFWVDGPRQRLALLPSSSKCIILHSSVQVPLRLAAGDDD